jgi:hypothetical protein
MNTSKEQSMKERERERENAEKTLGSLFLMKYLII